MQPPKQKLFYKLNWDEPSEPKVIGGLRVPMPKMPHESAMRNYKRKTSAQKFAPYMMPPLKGKNRMQLEEITERYWKLRRNGEWWLIKGEPFYLPGPFIIFLSFWQMWNGRRPSFRIEALEFFQIWYNLIEREPDCYGLFNMKPRRLGDTEKALFIMWERCTRRKNVRGGMQSYTDAEAAKAWRRLIKGHKNMPYIFKPTHSGSDAKQLAFVPPSEILTEKKLRDRAGKIQEIEQDDWLGSFMDYEATATGKYDGDQLYHYFLDEIWKIPPHRLNAMEQWKNIRKVITLHNEKTIYGKALLSSTVEEMNPNATSANDSSVGMATYFWENSDPTEKDENNRTYTGLYRCFRDFTLAAEVDAFGFHKVQQAREHREKRLDKARKKGDYGEVMNIYRKEPETPDEALSEGTDKCPLHPDMCYARLVQLRHEVDRYQKPQLKRVVEGNLVWSNGLGSPVKWVPTRHGKWHISQHPDPPNVRRVYKDRWMPMNTAQYRAGCDPYDANQVVTGGSDGAFVVKKRMNELGESERLQKNEQGEILNSEVMYTNQIVCDYKYRHKDPNLFYEDVLKTMIYYGCQVLIEADKPGIINWMVEKNFDLYMQREPTHFIGRSRRKGAKNYGVKATPVVINAYVERLTAHIYRYIWACHHPRVITQWAKFTVQKRTKFDLAVATGMAELADMDTAMDAFNNNTSNEWSNTPWQYVEA